MLLLSLIRRGARGGTFRQLARDVPRYAGKLRDLEELGLARKTNPQFQSLKRRFEADKAALQRAGVRIACKRTRDADDRYVIGDGDFFMPLVLLDTAPPPEPIDPRVEKVTASSDSMAAIVAAARRVDRLGNAALSAAARRALRRIVPSQSSGASPAIEPVGPGIDSGVLTLLLEALNRRKQVTFHYASPRRPTVRHRTVFPYGLYYANAWWYLVAWDTDPDAGGLRNFRLDRMRDVAMNARSPASQDYGIRREFDLQAWAAPRPPWEFGSGDANEVEVHLRTSAGPALAFAKQGIAVDRRRQRWRFAVRDAEFFALLALEHAEGLWVASPGPVRERWTALAEGALARHAGAPSLSGSKRRATTAPPRLPAPKRRSYAKAADQLSRLLTLLTLFADGRPHRVADVAAHLEISLKELYADIEALLTRAGDEATTDGLTVDFDGTYVRITSRKSILRPLRLTLIESKALTLGLDLLAEEWPEERTAVLRRAKHLVLKLTTPPSGAEDAGSAEANPDTMVSVVPYHPVWELQWIRVLQQAIAESRCVRISYGKSGATEPAWYHVKPYAVTESFGLLYLDGFVRQGNGDEHRLFRIDRVFSVQLTDERFVPEPGYDPHTRFDEKGRLRVPEKAQQLVVRYTGQAARLVAEREGVTVTSKGTLVWSYPLLDRSWAVRTVLQHGTEAEALSPPEIREYIVTVLDRALAEAAT